MENTISLAQPAEVEKNENSSRITPTSIADEMQRAYLDYAMSVIVSRALPDVRDGLKPVQRRIIYAMHEQGMSATSRYQKCAAVIGEVLKKYHPHGDISVYDALARMAQDFTLRYPLIDGQGNFGSVDGDPPAAMRYTEARLSKIAGELVEDIEKETVSFVPNYSGNYNEPILLPAKIPNLLLNGASGIAVGMATNIAPHNLEEIVGGILHLIETANNIELNKFSSTATTEDLLNFIKGPDFPTGGIIYNQKDVLQTYATGRGRIIARAKVTIEEDKSGRYIIAVTEIPYQVNKANLISKIADLVRDKKVDGISELRDESDMSGIRIAIGLRRDTKPQRILNLLYKHTELQKAFNSNMVSLINNEPKLMNLKTMLEEFIKHRQVVIVKRTEFLLKKAREREHILQGLKIALDHIEEVIKTIRNSKDAETAKGALMAKFGLTEIQAVAILEMQLRRLAALERQKIEDELTNIIKEIKRLKDILSSAQTVMDMIKEELLEIKQKYAEGRKTKVIKGDIHEPEEGELIKKEDVVITLTQTGYIKRLNIETFKKQGRGGKGVKGSELRENDTLDKILISNTHDKILFFTNKGRVYSIRSWEISESSKNSKGTAIINLLNLESQEKVTAVLPLSEKLAGSATPLVMITKLGVVKRVNLAEFENIRSTGIIAIKLSVGDSLEWVHQTTGEDEVTLTTSRGMSIRFKESDVRIMGRVAAGVCGIRLKKDDILVGSAVISSKDKNSKACLLVISNKGYGKKTRLSEYKIQHRGGSGILTYNTNDKVGNIVGAYIVDETSLDLLITSAEGKIIRLGIKEVPTLKRHTRGVRLIRLSEKDKVVSFTTM
ncbi:MAG: DNA gyrase subunit A [Patescibacteria group bacterium]|nr:DNA gyrase subunit A [Patescibacteria group bacterium]